MTQHSPDAPITVVVVDGSTARHRFVRAALQSDSQITVVAEVRTVDAAAAAIAEHRPSVVVLHLGIIPRGGRGGSIELIESIMADRPTPILGYVVNDRPIVAPEEALSAGAVTVLEEPRIDDAGAWDAYAASLRQQIRIASRVRVITHPRGRLIARQRAAPPEQGTSNQGRLVVVGASTGGPSAVQTLLRSLPADFPAAILVVQHMASGFIQGLAEWLDSTCPLPVMVGRDGHRLRGGAVCLAPDGLNTTVQSGMRLSCTPPVEGQLHVPGIDLAFASVAAMAGADAIGVLLTGMGRDGAAGLLTMRGRGALTLAQDESTSAVFGMPAAAAKIDAVDRVLPLEEIGAELIAELRRGVVPVASLGLQP